MGENLAIDGRLAVRTPMQWTSDPAAGFTTAPADAVSRPFPAGDFAPEHVNVAEQRTDPESLLNWFERLIRLRKSAPEVGWGDFEVLDAGDDAVLALRFQWGDRTTITLHNLAKRAVKASLAPGVEVGVLRDRFGSARAAKIRKGRASVPIEAYGYRWLGVEPPSPSA